MLFIYGPKEVLFKRSIALRLEIICQFVVFWNIKSIISLINYDSSLHGSQELDVFADLVSLFNVIILIRLMKITEFLKELEQW